VPVVSLYKGIQIAALALSPCGDARRKKLYLSQKKSLKRYQYATDLILDISYSSAVINEFLLFII
jgi:hypothetical protein